MKKWLIAIAAVVLLFGAVEAQAAVTVTYDLGTTNFTTALTGYSTYGDMMDGMRVTAYFVGSAQDAVWGDTGAGAGAASFGGWSLSESGDTFGGTWRLSNRSGSAITRLLIDAGPGDTIFDTRRVGDIGGTAGSERGWTFDVTGGSDAGLDILATYRDLVALTATAPVGDVFRRLDIQFRNVGGFATGRDLTFIADTDNILFAGDITPAVPEPASLIVWSAIGGLGIVGAWRRRRRAA